MEQEQEDANEEALELKERIRELQRVAHQAKKRAENARIGAAKKRKLDGGPGPSSGPKKSKKEDDEKDGKGRGKTRGRGRGGPGGGPNKRFDRHGRGNGGAGGAPGVVHNHTHHHHHYSLK